MWTAAFLLALICTVVLCLAVILIKWVITQISATIFIVLFAVMSLIFLIAIEERDYD